MGQGSWCIEQGVGERFNVQGLKFKYFRVSLCGGSPLTNHFNRSPELMYRQFLLPIPLP